MVPWSLRASSMCWSAGDTVVDEELATTMLFSAQRRHQDQTRYLHRCSVSSQLDYVGTSHPLSVSGKSPTMPRALCDLLALALSLAALNPRAFVLRAPAECRAASKREKPDASLFLGALSLPIACSWPLGSP